MNFCKKIWFDDIHFYQKLLFLFLFLLFFEKEKKPCFPGYQTFPLTLLSLKLWGFNFLWFLFLRNFFLYYLFIYLAVLVLVAEHGFFFCCYCSMWDDSQTRDWTWPPSTGSLEALTTDHQGSALLSNFLDPIFQFANISHLYAYVPKFHLI